jgi:hypothetical protein
VANIAAVIGRNGPDGTSSHAGDSPGRRAGVPTPSETPGGSCGPPVGGPAHPLLVAPGHGHTPIPRAGPTMIPRESPANGVHWLTWLADRTWQCRECGASGLQPPFRDVEAFARWVGDLKRAHAACGEPVVLDVDQVGHPLNPDRPER